MTVKIITEQTDGLKGTHLFSAQRVDHYENQVKNNFVAPDETFAALVQRKLPKYVVSGLGNYSSSQNMDYSLLSLFGENDDISPVLVSAPATVYIMAGGKTIDSYQLSFID